MPRRSFRAALLLVAVAAPLRAIDPPASGSTTVSYYKDIRPILQQHCQGCHQPAKAQGGYVMSEYALMFAAGETGKKPIVPGKPEASFLLEEIRVVNGQHEMPKNREALTTKQYGLIESWIRQGAKDDTPASARTVDISPEKPPVYSAPPVVTSLAFHPTEKLLAISGYHEILLYSADATELIARLIGVSERVQSLAFSPDGKRLAAAGGSPGRFGEVQVWDVAKRKLLISVPMTADTLYGLSWSPDSSMIAIGCTDNTVRGIDPNTGKQTLQMGTHSDWVLGTTFSRDGKHLVSISRDMTAKLTDVPTQRFIDNITSITPGVLKGGLMSVAIRPKTPKWFQKLPEDTPGVPRMLYDELLFAGADGIPRIYKMHRETKRVIGDDANKVKEFEAMPGRISAVAFDKAGQRFAAVSSLDGKGYLGVYDIKTGKVVRGAQLTSPVYTVAWTPDQSMVASAGFDGMVHFHNPSDGKKLRSVPIQPKAIGLKAEARE